MASTTRRSGLKRAMGVCRARGAGLGDGVEGEHAGRHCTGHEPRSGRGYGGVDPPLATRRTQRSLLPEIAPAHSKTCRQDSVVALSWAPRVTCLLSVHADERVEASPS